MGFQNKTLSWRVCSPLPAGWIGEYRSGGHRWWESQTYSRAHLEHHSPLAGMCVCFSLRMWISESRFCLNWMFFHSSRPWWVFTGKKRIKRSRTLVKQQPWTAPRPWVPQLFVFHSLQCIYTLLSGSSFMGSFPVKIKPPWGVKLQPVWWWDDRTHSSLTRKPDFNTGLELPFVHDAQIESAAAHTVDVPIYIPPVCCLKTELAQISTTKRLGSSSSLVLMQLSRWRSYSRCQGNQRESDSKRREGKTNEAEIASDDASKCQIATLEL